MDQVRAIELLVGVQFLIIGLSHLFQPRAWVSFFITLREKGPAGVFANGFLSLLSGSLIVAFHNVWTGLPMVLTIIGWAQVVKATMSFVAPRLAMRSLQRVSMERAWQFRVAGAMSLALSGLMAYLLLPVATVAGDSPATAQEVAASGPPIPFEDIGACPFEGCVYRDWVANGPATARAGRSADAAAAFTVEKGDHVQALTGIVVTLKPGRVQFHKAVDLVSTGGPIHVEPGETLYLLTYHGEGAFSAWFKGRLYDEVDGSEFINGLCGRNVTCNGTIIEKPQTVWWIRLRSTRGLTGWTDEQEKFDNKDRFG